jgi:carbon-monoxide dehydrogenase large subunit
MVGTHSNGQGHETTFAQIAADAFGLPAERFRFRQGDTDDLDSGGGPWRGALDAPGRHRAC